MCNLLKMLSELEGAGWLDNWVGNHFSTSRNAVVGHRPTLNTVHHFIIRIRTIQNKSLVWDRDRENYLILIVFNSVCHWVKTRPYTKFHPSVSKIAVSWIKENKVDGQTDKLWSVFQPTGDTIIGWFISTSFGCFIHPYKLNTSFCHKGCRT